jgi:GTP cyclohydrolase I
MRQIPVAEDTFRKLIELKNHWSFQYRKVTNKEVLKILDKIKMEIYGYDSSTPSTEIERISNSKTREQLEREMERFAKAYKELLVSGYDFEPNYTLDEHIKKMIEVITESEEIQTPIYL